MGTSVRIDKNIEMKTRDGVTLRSDIYRPDDAEKHPVILMRTPYGKRYSTRSGDFLSAIEAAEVGYIVVIQDCRGRFASDGDWIPEFHEAQDGYDAVEWAAAEPWCDGNVGMSGGSYLANAQWQAAAEQPPHLKAINPSVCQSSVYAQETRESGGMPLELITGWFMMMADNTINKMEQQGQDVTEWRRLVHRALLNPEEVYNHLPLKDAPHFQIEGMSEIYNAWVSTNKRLELLPSEDDFFWPYHKVQVPGCHTGGWYDDYAGSAFRNFLGMRDKGASQKAREGQHMIYGPWAHAANLPGYAGGLHFGPAASAGAAQLHEQHIAFFEKYLRGRDINLPAIRYFVMGRNMWQTADSWPPAATEWKRLFLHSDGKANSARGDGRLDWDEPASETPDVYHYDPMSPVPTLGGRNVPSGSLVPGPLDQSRIEKRDDVLCYTTRELEEDLEVTGPLMLHLFASTSAADTDFMAKLVDVHPDGAAYNIAEGYIRARYKDDFLHPKPIEPGAIIEYEIDMASTSNLFRRGHRIRIEIASSNFPRIDRNMNTGNGFGEDATGPVATQTVFHEAGFASYIDLPVQPNGGA